MSLFCKTCNGRRLPKWMKDEKSTYWLCETCKNFVDGENTVIREND
ncbi:MAG: hypothetical protein KJN83_00520 [Nitrosopumilus sp.]|nr:hypothetical protein [Nitrosopumilus sp.]